MADSCDFPAAHSMDTTWFAVDREGRVAVFDSGEAGAVPTEGYLGEDWGEVEEAVRGHAKPGGRRFTRSGLVDGSGNRHLTLNGQPLRGEFVFLVSPALAEGLVKEQGARRLEVDEGAAVTLTDPPASLVEALHERSDCEGCAWFFDLESDDSPDLARHGLFRFEHRTDNWIAGPYGLVARPETPVTIDQLPDEVREACVRYDGRFAEGPEIQPVEHWKSESWGAAWMSADRRRIAALPGREKDYAAEYPEVAELGRTEGIAVEPPPAPPAGRKPWWRFW